ncbi:D-tagatose-bisphosphate aldolase, class II, non-catalytic subunit [Microbacterium oleivorans]|uniref:Tagatose-bisphosphate aldolase n=1 Tax=Microbacterium oleivorans TaxID=273677 RepID=A0A177KAJ3_9MICO|nr:D-tagatose-bisphosphate aldolase, class II, non-catalytic subunit [Microbacterium oleivorans]OAH50164.1 tagatose-bisphosphate aldolase [Microbacterium oleivorans]
MSNPLISLVERHKSGASEGIYSVCSAHPLVLRAAMRQSVADGTPLLVEATSNQVDQFGGYTGRTPAQFRADVEAIAAEEGFPQHRLILGGDHLGPNRWRKEDAESAMGKAEDLVRAYVTAGYSKIHLDCSMPCAGETAPLSDEVVAARAVRLLAVAEQAAADAGVDPASLVYVIGTEVPTPGGAAEKLEDLQPTTPAFARRTLEIHRRAIADAGLADVWPRVIALVVQPAVEFDHLDVVDYKPEATTELRHVLDDEPGMVFEAHSTDYQRQELLRELVRAHWAVLKVGPGLTFALREALFALAAIEREIVPTGEQSQLRETIESTMLADPSWWESYYEGTDTEQALARAYSYSDRVRYYWPVPAIDAAVQRLFTNLRACGIPEPLLSQYLPAQFERVRAGELTADPADLAIDRVRDVLRVYAAATADDNDGK